MGDNVAAVSAPHTGYQVSKLTTLPDQLVSGSFAEYLSVPWDKVAKLPPHVDIKVGTAVPAQGLTGKVSRYLVTDYTKTILAQH